MSFSFASITPKKGLSPFLLQVKKYFYPLFFVNFQPLIRIDTRVLYFTTKNTKDLHKVHKDFVSKINS
jgi:hypothetical protein